MVRRGNSKLVYSYSPQPTVCGLSISLTATVELRTRVARMRLPPQRERRSRYVQRRCHPRPRRSLQYLPRRFPEAPLNIYMRASLTAHVSYRLLPCTRENQHHQGITPMNRPGAPRGLFCKLWLHILVGHPHYTRWKAYGTVLMSRVHLKTLHHPSWGKEISEAA
jgi:hypothetical protein